jgi:hypothetical protein
MMSSTPCCENNSKRRLQGRLGSAVRAIVYGFGLLRMGMGALGAVGMIGCAVNLLRGWRERKERKEEDMLECIGRGEVGLE